jgi:hypothetical protein
MVDEEDSKLKKNDFESSLDSRKKEEGAKGKWRKIRKTA